MGAALSAIQDALGKSTDATEAASKETLNTMSALAKTKLEHFYATISNDNVDTKLIPISKVLNHWTYIECTLGNEENISSTITEAVKDFSSGPVGEGIAKLGAGVIHKLLGASKGSMTESQKYAITVDELAGVSRIDTFYFCYNFEAEAIVKRATSILAVCVVQSAVDMRDIDANMRRILVNSCFINSKLEERKAILAYLESTISPEDVSEDRRRILDKWETKRKRALKLKAPPTPPGEAEETEEEK